MSHRLHSDDLKMQTNKMLLPKIIPQSWNAYLEIGCFRLYLFYKLYFSA